MKVIKKDNPLVSIVIPVYNAAKFIEECVKSVCSQSYPYIEILLVDDGSTDISGAVCDDFARRDKRIRVIHKKNGGVSSARNVGIEAATGDYLIFVDSDDSIEPSAVEILMEAVVNTKEIDFIASSYYDLCSENKKVVKLIVEQDTEIVGSELKPFYLDHYMLFTTPWSKLFVKKIISDNAIRFDESVKYGEDMIFNMQYLKYANHIVLLSSPIYNYRLLAEGSAQTKYYPKMSNYRIKTFEATERLVQASCEQIALKFLSKGLGHYGYYINQKQALDGIDQLIRYFSEIISYEALVKEFGTIKAFIIKRKLSLLFFLFIILKNKMKDIVK